MKNFISTMIAASILGLALTGCEKDDDNPPVIPSVESMTIDFSNFQDDTKSAFDTKGTSYYYLVSASVSAWSFIFDNVVTIPVHAFEVTVTNEPIYEGDGSWVWSHSYTEGGHTYTSALTGTVVNDVVNWEMKVSCDGNQGYNEFVWFTGTSSTDGKNGSWEFRHKPDNDDVLLTVEWASDGETVEKVKITYALEDNIIPGIVSNFYGSYIQYNNTATDPAYNSSFEINFNHNCIGLYNLLAEWNTSNHSGRVQCKSFFNDEVWYSWDATYSNQVTN